MTTSASRDPQSRDDATASRRLYYEQHGRVTRRQTLGPDRERVAVIRDCLPPDARSIIDVGCGVGLVTRPLTETHDVVGLDFSKDVHRGAIEPRVCGLATRLPFRSGSFDLALATQIVEHLSEKELQVVAEEMQRVSRRYVLITTTYMEDLREATVPCPRCGSLFNAYGHLRTFDEESLAALFPACRALSTRTYALGHPYPRLLVTLNQRFFGFWHYELALVCTACGHDRFMPARRGLGHLSRLSNLMARLWPRRRRPTRILMLLEKTQS